MGPEGGPEEASEGGPERVQMASKRGSSRGSRLRGPRFVPTWGNHDFIQFAV